MNGVIIQFFHWYHPGNLWKEFTEKAEDLQKHGFTAVWFPPAMKCADGKEGRGYDVYDLYDIGEFDQKGSVATRHGTRDEYLEAIEKAHKYGIQVYADIVLNHKLGADEEEQITVHEVSNENRNEVVSDPFDVTAKTKFTFPGRNNKYSEFVWNHQCFSGIDIVQNGNELTGVFKIHNEYGMDWNNSASRQLGNYDYLMGADVEFRNPYVIEELKKWISWFITTTEVDGLRLDAVKHISSEFLKDWTNYIKSEINSNLFLMGEFWKDDTDELAEFYEKMEHQLSLFDVPLHFNFFRASQEGSRFDLSIIFKNTFTERYPFQAVSFVGNHDTQQLQALESPVENWFRPIAYALILLSEKGYPCVFYPDLYGAEYEDIDEKGDVKQIVMPKLEILPKLLEARKKYANGGQINYFNHPNCIAWIRTGNDHSPGCIVIISNGEEGYKEIELGNENAESKFIDFLGIRQEQIVLNKNGKGKFWVNPGSVSVWVNSDMI